MQFSSETDTKSQTNVPPSHGSSGHVQNPEAETRFVTSPMLTTTAVGNPLSQSGHSVGIPERLDELLDDGLDEEGLDELELLDDELLDTQRQGHQQPTRATGRIAKITHHHTGHAPALCELLATGHGSQSALMTDHMPA